MKFMIAFPSVLLAFDFLISSFPFSTVATWKKNVKTSRWKLRVRSCRNWEFEDEIKINYLPKTFFLVLLFFMNFKWFSTSICDIVTFIANTRKCKLRQLFRQFRVNWAKAGKAINAHSTKPRRSKKRKKGLWPAAAKKLNFPFHIVDSFGHWTSNLLLSNIAKEAAT